MSTKTNQIDHTLDVFIEKAKRLTGSSFKRTMAALGGKVGGQVHWDHHSGWANSIEGPDDDQVGAMLLTLRFFLQDNEVSIRRVADLLKSLDDIDAALLDDYRRVRGNLKTYLDSPIGLNLYGEIPSRGRVLFTILYGDLAHAERDKAALCKRWMEHPWAATMVRLEFLAILGTVVNTVHCLAGVVEKIRDQRRN